METDRFSIIAKLCVLLMLFGPAADVHSLDIRKYDLDHWPLEPLIIDGFVGRAYLSDEEMCRTCRSRPRVGFAHEWLKMRDAHFPFSCFRAYFLARLGVASQQPFVSVKLMKPIKSKLKTGRRKVRKTPRAKFHGISSLHENVVRESYVEKRHFRQIRKNKL